ncbi:hypothetical protein BDP55DRAFT_630361 [Colletotrichum godetiae]|uniref:Uncharacterized protein n=1 Tax=Colletotrichum godetiae TaxID=1209918 RepID=A0AAJ0EUJ9_9PEZI|nr:uncharacterized protein BDP55DRAFT_630361 [Colletotrichum godetiae]KAK1687714.1 hypothetical protein BDP55DRAFT_630361 [Colletotrichum godetiae]
MSWSCTVEWLTSYQGLEDKFDYPQIYIGSQGIHCKDASRPALNEEEKPLVSQRTIQLRPGEAMNEARFETCAIDWTTQAVVGEARKRQSMAWYGMASQAKAGRRPDKPGQAGQYCFFRKFAERGRGEPRGFDTRDKQPPLNGLCSKSVECGIASDGGGRNRRSWKTGEQVSDDAGLGVPAISICSARHIVGSEPILFRETLRERERRGGRGKFMGEAPPFGADRNCNDCFPESETELSSDASKETDQLGREILEIEEPAQLFEWAGLSGSCRRTVESILQLSTLLETKLEAKDQAKPAQLSHLFPVEADPSTRRDSGLVEVATESTTIPYWLSASALSAMTLPLASAWSPPRAVPSGTHHLTPSVHDMPLPGSWRRAVDGTDQVDFAYTPECSSMCMRVPKGTIGDTDRLAAYMIVDFGENWGSQGRAWILVARSSSTKH